MRMILAVLIALFMDVQVHAQQTSMPAKSNGNKRIAVSGYMDAQMIWGRGSLNLNSGAGMNLPGDPTGFAIYQGAVMLSDEIERAELLIDLPFRQRTEVENINVNGVNARDAKNSFDLAVKDAQAYVKYQMDTGLFWQIGQFDSSYGLEGNDTVDLIFPQFGILQDLTPNTHTGIQVGYTVLPFFVSVVAANGAGHGVQNSLFGPQFGIRVGWSQEPYQLSVGALYTDAKGDYVLSSGVQDYKPSILGNVVFTSTFRRLEYGLEFNVAQSIYDKAETVSGLKDVDLIYGVLAQLSYALTDKTVAGMRYEHSQNDGMNFYSRYLNAVTNATTQVNQITGQGGHLSKLTFALRRILNEDLSVKAGVEFVSLNVGDDAPNVGKNHEWVQGSVGAVYSF